METAPARIANPGGDRSVLDVNWHPQVCGVATEIALNLYRRNPHPFTDEPRGYVAVSSHEIEPGTGCFVISDRAYTIRLQLKEQIAAEDVQFARLGLLDPAQAETAAGHLWLGLRHEPNGAPRQYVAGERIRLGAHLTYYGGPTRRLEYSAGMHQIEFGLEQLDGPIYPVPASSIPCMRYSLKAGEPFREPFRKMGGFDATDPLADWYRDYFADEALRLPAGVYLLSALAYGWLDGCAGEDGFSLASSLVIEVKP